MSSRMDFWVRTPQGHRCPTLRSFLSKGIAGDSDYCCELEPLLDQARRQANFAEAVHRGDGSDDISCMGLGTQVIVEFFHIDIPGGGAVVRQDFGNRAPGFGEVTANPLSW